MADPFAAVADVEAWVAGTGGAPLTEDEQALATILLEAISDGLRADAGQVITQDTSTVVLYPLPGACEVVLPQQPVTAVTSVLVDGQASTDWELRDGRLYRAEGWGWHTAPVLTVTFTYGYEIVPEDVVQYCVMAASEGLNGSAPLKSETVVEYAQTFAEQPPGEHLALSREAIIRRYSFGGVSRVPSSVAGSRRFWL